MIGVPMKTLDSALIPRYERAVLRCLQFSGDSRDDLSALDDAEWEALLTFCDRGQITLLLEQRTHTVLPSHVANRISRNRESYAARFKSVQTSIQEIAQAFSRRSIPLVLLKGVTHAPHFSTDPVLRSQGDIDLWCQPRDIGKAKAELEALGYRAWGKSKGRHLDPMIRETTWNWIGDYYASDLPIPVDLHYELWDSEKEFVAGPDERQVWKRCVPVYGGEAHQLALPDMLAFAALHSLMHLLHGDVRLQRVWEIAFFLNGHAQDEEFWKQWTELHSNELRGLQTLVFCLAKEWFGCRCPEVVLREAKNLSRSIQLWISKYAWSPVESLFQANKDELWLNLALLNSRRSKTAVLARRLLPFHAIEVHGSHQAPARRALRQAVARLKHHLGSMPATCWSGLLWWMSLRRRGSRFSLL